MALGIFAGIIVAACVDVAHVAGVAAAHAEATYPAFVWPVSQPARAVAGPPRTVVAAKQVCLDANAGHHPLSMPYLTTWRQIEGAPVALDAQDCFMAPAPGRTLAFLLTADDLGQKTYDTLLLEVVAPDGAQEVSVDSARTIRRRDGARKPGCRTDR